MRALEHLVARWRAKASDLHPFDNGAALAFQVCARDLDAAIGGQSDTGAEFVVAELHREPGLSTTELRDRARMAGVSITSVTRTLPLLEARGVIAFDLGKRNRKRWRLRESPEKSGAELVPSLSDRLNGVGAAEGRRP